MNPRTLFRSGLRIGPWKLIQLLGKGGNGQVWLAEDDANQRFAVKFCLYAKNEKRYLRFCDEVTAHGLIGDHAGVLPLYRSNIPEQPSLKNPAWFSMPKATPILDALDTDFTLRKVVEAVASIAETLSWLAENHSLYHRDIKPGNLYNYGGNWVLGDPGLAKFGPKQAKTSTSERIGPAFFIAPEMLHHTKMQKLDLLMFIL